MGIAAYLLLFISVGLLFIFVNLLVGRFVRPDNPNEEKAEIYECGEPAIGSSYIQFDLRFYVIALLFIIFDVEVAFFFPWAVVFGKSENMADPNFAVVAAENDTLSEDAKLLYREMGVRDAELPTQIPASLVASYETKMDRAAPAAGELTKEDAAFVIKEGSSQLMWLTFADIGVFFAVLMVGFFYVWRRGDLDWVRAMINQKMQAADRAPPTAAPASRQESVLSA